MAISIFALATLGQVKDALKLASTASTQRDRFLTDTINRTSDEIERFCRRQFVARDYFQDWDGFGDDRIFLDHYPVLNVATLIDDTDRDYGSTDVIAKTDILIDKDKGVIQVWNGTGIFAVGKQNVRIKYHAGFALVDVEWGKNKLDFRERTGGTLYTVQVPPKQYDVFELATTIGISMSSLGLNSYKVTYDTLNRKYTIAKRSGSVGTLFLPLSTGTNTTQSVHSRLGFATANLSGATSYTPATAITPRIPREIEQACLDIVTARYDFSEWGGGRRGLKSERIGDYSVSFNGTPVPQYTVETLKRYQRSLLGRKRKARSLEPVIGSRAGIISLD